MGAKQPTAPAVRGRVGGEHVEGRVAVPAAVQQQRVGHRVAVVRRPLAPEHLDDLQRPVDPIRAGEHAGECVARFRPGVRDRFHDPDPPAAVGVQAEYRDDGFMAGVSRSVPAPRNASQLRGGFLGAAGAREHERVHPPRPPALGDEPSPLAGGGGREAVASGLRRNAGGALGKGGVPVQPGGIDVAPDRQHRIRLLAPARRDLCGEQGAQHPGRKPGRGLRGAGRGVGGGGPGRARGEQDRTGGGRENEGMKDRGAHCHPDSFEQRRLHGLDESCAGRPRESGRDADAPGEPRPVVAFIPCRPAAKPRWTLEAVPSSRSSQVYAARGGPCQSRPGRWSNRSMVRRTGPCGESKASDRAGREVFPVCWRWSGRVRLSRPPRPFRRAAPSRRPASRRAWPEWPRGRRGTGPPSGS